MKKEDNNVKVFFALLRAGLWESGVQLLPFGTIDFAEVYRLAEEQSVVGLVAAGLNHVTDTKIPKIDFLQFLGVSMHLEDQNKAMNSFIADLIEKLRKAGIYALLVKGQGIAQCYERPLWRSCGDVDLFLSEENYKKAKAFLKPIATKVDTEGAYSKHQGMTIDSWVVELHGALRCGLSSRIDRVMDGIKDDVILKGNVRTWANGKTQVFLLGINNDAIYVFIHFLNHFYKGGVGLRQICDWCRLLYTYKETLNYGLLESRIRRSGLISEWKAFGAYAVSYLGMPAQAMPLLDERWKMVDGRCVIDSRLRRKAKRINNFILEVGNFGHNRDTSYYGKYPFIVRKAFSFGVRVKDLIRHARIFPMDSIRFLFGMTIYSFKAVSHGE